MEREEIFHRDFQVIFGHAEQSIQIQKVLPQELELSRTSVREFMTDIIEEGCQTFPIFAHHVLESRCV